jgi:hypothetical protein
MILASSNAAYAIGGVNDKKMIKTSIEISRLSNSFHGTTGGAAISVNNGCRSLQRDSLE